MSVPFFPKPLIDRDRFRWLVGCLQQVKEEHPGKLNNWEMNFIDSMARYLGEEEKLSEAQVEKVEELYRDVDSRPLIKSYRERRREDG